jgi:hypothetical protein
MEAQWLPATIQSGFGEKKYPIGSFILERARALGMSRSDLVHRPGYRDTETGHGALSAVLLTGLMAPQMANHLADAIEADDAPVGSVIDATMRQRCDEARLDHRYMRPLIFTCFDQRSHVAQKRKRL